MGYMGVGYSGYEYETCPLCGQGMWNGRCENPDCEYHWNPKEDEEMVAQHLLVTNHEGMGQQDAEEFMSDAVLALVALRYVAANPEGCRFIPIPSKGGDK